MKLKLGLQSLPLRAIPFRSDKYAHLAPEHIMKAAFVMDEIYNPPTYTKLAS